MTAKRKPHTIPCSQLENIAKINELLVGNHEPQNGVVYKVMRASDDINTIKDQLVGVNENHSVLLKEMIGIGTKIANIEGVQAGREIKDDNSNNSWTKWLTIAGVVSAIFLGVWSNLKTETQTSKYEKEVIKNTNDDYHNILLSIDSLKMKYSVFIDKEK